jgi:hypothetical protein
VSNVAASPKCSGIDFEAEAVLLPFPMPENEPEGEIYTLVMLEQLREDLRLFGNAKTELYCRIDSLLRELANPNLSLRLRTRLPGQPS